LCHIRWAPGHPQIAQGTGHFVKMNLISGRVLLKVSLAGANGFCSEKTRGWGHVKSFHKEGRDSQV